MGSESNAGPDTDEVFRATPDIRGGVACFTGTRVGVSQLLGYLRDGCTIDDFLSDFPTVTKDQAQRAIERIDDEYIGGMERECAGVPNLKRLPVPREDGEDFLTAVMLHPAHHRCSGVLWYLENALWMENDGHACRGSEEKSVCITVEPITVFMTT